LLGKPSRQGHPIRQLPIQTDLEGVLAGTGKGNIEHQNRARLHVDHSGGRLAKLHCPFTSQELTAAVIDKADPDGMNPNLGAPAPHSKHQVGAGVYRRKVREPHVLKHAQHAELALLIDQGVVGDDGKIEVQGSGDPDGVDDVVLFDLVYHVHALGYLAKNRMHPVEMGLGRMGDEELAAAMDKVPVVCLWVFRWVSHLIL
jgi:hypothetical protein